MLNNIKVTRILRVLQKTVRPLVPARVRPQKQHKSLSLVIKGNDNIKPFAIYSIKKDRLSESMEVIKPKSCNHLQINTNSCLPTHDNPTNSFTEFVRIFITLAGI